MGRSTPCSMTMRTYETFSMLSLASAIHSTKINITLRVVVVIEKVSDASDNRVSVT